MEEKNEILPPEEEIAPETDAPQEEVPVKPAWQRTKEGWYDKIPLTVKQLDWIIGLGFAGLIITFIIIALDAMEVF